MRELENGRILRNREIIEEMRKIERKTRKEKGYIGVLCFCKYLTKK